MKRLTLLAAVMIAVLLGAITTLWSGAAASRCETVVEIRGVVHFGANDGATTVGVGVTRG